MLLKQPKRKFKPNLVITFLTKKKMSSTLLQKKNYYHAYREGILHEPRISIEHRI